MRQKKYLGIFLSLLLVIGVITGCGQKNDDADNQTAEAEVTEEAQEEQEETTEEESSGTELTKLNYALTYETNELSGILKLAEEQGYLQEELEAVGYELNILGFAQAGPAINEAIASGAVDIANYGNLPAAVAKSNGVGVSIVGISDNQSNFSVLVKEDSGIETVKDLEGKKVIVGKGTIIEQYWDNLVKEYGVDISKVEVINDVASASSTFATGSADAWISSSIYEFLLDKQVPVKAIESTVTNHPEWAGETIFAVRDSFKEEHPEVVTAFLTAYIRGYNYALEHEEETYQSLVSDVLSLETAKQIYGSITPVFSNFNVEITNSEVGRYKELNDFLLNKELIGSSVEAETILDSSFYEEAKKKAEAAGTASANKGKETEKEETESDAKVSTDTVKIGFAASDGSGTLSDVVGYAKDQGYIEEELDKLGVTVEWSPMVGAGPAINEAMASEDLDIGILGDIPAIIAKAGGTDTTIVSIGDYNKADILVKPDSEIEKVADLKGKKVATGKGQFMHAVLASALEAEGLTLNDIEFVNIAGADAVSAFLSGDVDAICIGFSSEANLVLEGEAKIIGGTSVDSSNYTLSVMEARTKFAKENPGVIEGILKGVLRAKAEYEADNSLSKAQWVKSGLTEESYDFLYPNYEYIAPIQIKDEFLEKTKQTIQFLKDNELIAADAEINVEEWFDSSYYDAASQE